MTAPLLLHAFSTFATGGPQVRFATIANCLGARFRHAIFAMDGNYAARERLDPGLDVTFPEISLMKGDTFGSARRLRAVLRVMRPSTLVTSNWGTIEWAIANRWPLVRHIHVEDGFGPEERSAQLPRRVWMRRVFLAGRTVVVPSLTLRRIATDVWQLNPARVRYVPNGIELGRFATGQPAVWPGDGPVIGTVAALRAEKNLGRLLHAFRHVLAQRPARLVIVGAGPERAGLEGLAGELGVADRVHWTGHVAEPAPLLRGFDVFALSSDTEQMPLSLLEAMAAGLPVAATDVGDVAAILPEMQRPYVTALDPVALGGALDALLDDGALRGALGAANTARVAGCYYQSAMVEAWAALFGAANSDAVGGAARSG